MSIELSGKNKLIFTIDWEDFGQLSHKNRTQSYIPPKSQIDRQTAIILDLLDKHDVKATFYILGICALDKRHLVKKIHKAGHEIALHGYWHDALPSISINEIKADIQKAKSLVEDITGEQVYGYRAPYFSLNDKRLEVLEVLSEMRFLYDSSISPASKARYSIPGFKNGPQMVGLDSNRAIVELPMTVYQNFGASLPISGGGYFRILPQFLLKYIFNNALALHDNNMIYLHPYEFDNEKINVEQYSDEGYFIKKKDWINFKWNLNRKSILKKVEYFLDKYEFSTCKEVAENVKNSK